MFPIKQFGSIEFKVPRGSKNWIVKVDIGR